MSSTEITIRKYAAGLNDTATAVMDDCREEINLYKQATKDVDEKGGEMAVRNKDGDKYMNKESAKMIIDKLESQAKMALRMKRTVEALPKDGVVEDENEKIKNMFIEGMTRMGVYARPK